MSFDLNLILTQLILMLLIHNTRIENIFLPYDNDIVILVFSSYLKKNLGTLEQCTILF